MPNGNYSFVIDASFNPMSFRDRLAPFLIAKEAYDKAEQEYIDRQDKIDKYSFLNDYDDSSTAKQLYQGYVNEYNKSFDDFSKNGLSQGNRRSWLNVRRRYQKNIGRLEDADKAMQEELTRRQTLDANDPTRIYAKDTVNLSIDDYLDRKKPNDYSVSGNALYKRGAEIGASASSRIYSDPRVKDLTKYYQDFVQTVGYSPELLAEFSQRLDAIPEFQRAVESTLKEYGVTDNLTGNNYQRARQSVINGIINGSVYKRTDSPQRNPDVMDAYQQAQIDRADKAYKLDLAEKGLKEEDGKIVIDENGLPFQLQKLKNDKTGLGGNSGGKGSNYVPSYSERTYVSNNGQHTTTILKSDEDYKAALSNSGPVSVVPRAEGGTVVYDLKGNSGTVYATIRPDKKGNYNVKNTAFKIANYEKDFGEYDSDYDLNNLKALGKAIGDVIKREGPQGYMNYNYYLEPDNNGSGNDNGGYYIDPLGRQQKTTANDDPLASLQGVDFDFDVEQKKQ